MPGLIAAKLRPPSRPRSRVDRRRLIDLWDHVVAHPLTLVSAPAGFGKTTLLLDWVDRAQDGLGWLSLDERDDDPERFARYLAAAAAAALRIQRQQLDAPSLEALVDTLLNAFAESEGESLVILDDFHLVHSEHIHAAIGTLVEHLPRTGHLVVASRRDPHLPLSRLRGRGQVFEVRADDLRFTLAETEQFFAGMGGELATTDVTLVQREIEGWAAGLQMAALQHRQVGTAITRTRRNELLFDYLAEEVVGAQPAEVQDFLLRTSIVDRVSGPLANALTGHCDGAERLASLARGELFTTPLDEEGGWYRYHHLLREYLDRVRPKRVGVEVVELHGRATRWFEDAEQTDEAVHHALASGDTGFAVDVIERAMPRERLRSGGVSNVITRWLEPLPRALVENRPRLAIPAAVSSLMAGRVQEAAALTEHVAEMIDGRSPAPHLMRDGERAGHRAAIALLRTYVSRYRGRPEEALAIVNEALTVLERDATQAQATLRFIRAVLLFEAWHAAAPTEVAEAAERCFIAGHLSGAAGLLTIEGYRLLLEGSLREAEAHVRRSIARCYERQAVPVVGSLHALLAEIAYERNDLAIAEAEARRAMELGSPGAAPGLFIPPEVTLARILLARGDADASRDTLDAWATGARLVETVQGQTLFPALEADLALRLGDVHAALAWADLPAPPRCGPWQHEFPGLIRSRAWQQAGRTEEALAEAIGVLNSSEEAGRRGRALEASVRAALCLQAMGRVDEAAAMLQSALTHLGGEGYVRTVIDEGEPLLRLLMQADHGGVLAGRFASGAPTDAAHEAGGPDALSERELEVLRLLASGMSNRELADTLVVSLDTVKTHLKNVYGKLDVHSRMQALVRARELRLVE